MMTTHTGPVPVPSVLHQPRKTSLNNQQEKLLEAWSKNDLGIVKELESQGISLLTPNQSKSLLPTKQVEAMGKLIESKINSKQVQKFLKNVVDGNLTEVSKQLKEESSLALETGTIKNLAGQIFTGMTGLQYAAWSLDQEMYHLIASYLGSYNTGIQLQALFEEPEHYSPYGSHYNITPLITKSKTYLDYRHQWKDEEQREYWQKEIGGEQMRCPAWLIYLWSEKGANVAWVTKDFSQGFQRQYKEMLDSWFTENYNNGKGVGSTWAVVRGLETAKIITEHYTKKMPNSSGRALAFDIDCLETIKKNIDGLIAQFKANINTKSWLPEKNIVMGLDT